MRTCVLAVGGGCVLCGALVFVEALAQTVLPGAIQPGQIERQFQKEPEPRAKPGAITIPDSVQKPPPNAQTIRFVLKHLTVDGVSVYSGQYVQSLYAELLGREVALADIYRVADTLTARYRNDGYILSQVIVPAQAIEGGVVRLQVLEGYVANVRFEGGDDALRHRAVAYTDKIKASRPLAAAILERYLLLLNDLPGVTARATLIPAKTERGASDLVVQLTERMVGGGLSLDNRGSRALGPGRLSGDLEIYSMLGRGARTGFKYVTAGNGELNFLSLSHDQLVGTEGGKLGFTASFARSRPAELAIIPLNLETKSNTVALAYSHPLLRSRTENLYLRGTFSAHNGETTIFGIDDTEDRIRALRVGLTYDRADALGGVNIADVEFSQGLRALGASSNGDPFLSRPNGRVDFSKVTVYAARLQSLPANWSVLAAFNAQYAFTELLSSELYSFGGEQFGRGYDPSELVGDHGIGLKLELRHTRALQGASALTYTTYGFYDAGQVRQRTSFPGVDASQSAASAGLGIRLSSGRHLSAVVEIAKPLTRIVAQEEDRKLRLYAGISARF